jgi:hypothetical protein
LDTDNNSRDIEEAKPKEDAVVSETDRVGRCHFRNKELSIYWRYGVPVSIILLIALFLASHIGSGIKAVRTFEPNSPLLDPQTDTLFVASIFTSVRSLWDTGSKGLAILVCITSISWPYIKLLLSLFAWMVPYKHPRRRERLIEVLDAFGKWSFVDIIVFTEIVSRPIRNEAMTLALTHTCLLGGSISVYSRADCCWHGWARCRSLRHPSLGYLRFHSCDDAFSGA